MEIAEIIAVVADLGPVPVFLLFGYLAFTKLLPLLENFFNELKTIGTRQEELLMTMHQSLVTIEKTLDACQKRLERLEQSDRDFLQKQMNDSDNL